MDGLLGNALPGVVVAVIGAVIGAAAAYYFAQRQARQRQVYEQQEIDARRAEGVGEISSRAHPVFEALEKWTEQIVNMHEKLPDKVNSYRYTQDGNYMPYSQSHYLAYLSFLAYFETVRKREQDVAETLDLMRRCYQEQKPHLGTSSRDAYEAFNRAAAKQYTLLREALSRSEIQRFTNDEYRRLDREHKWRQRENGPIFVQRRKRNDQREDQEWSQEWRKRMEPMTEAVHNALNVDLRKHIAALDHEADRLVRIANN
jgi:hypothetical protein